MSTDVKLTLSVDGDAQAVKSIGNVERALGDLEGMSGLAKTGLLALGSALSVGTFVAMAKGVIDMADNLNDLSKTTSIAVDRLAGLKLAAKQSGGDLEGIAASINKLSVAMGKDSDKFAALGVTAKDPLQAFGQLADVFSAIQDPQLRAALGAEALGKSWASAAPLLSEGGKNIAAMVEKGTALSGVTQDMANQADAFNDSLAVMQAASEGTRIKIANELLPTLNTLMQEFSNSKDGGTSLAESLGGGLRVVLQQTAILVTDVSFVLKGMGREIGGIVAQFSALGEGGGVFSQSGRAAWSAVGQAMREDAAQARKDLDELQGRILGINANTGASTAQMASAEESKKAAAAAIAFLKLQADADKAAAEAARKYAEELKKQADLLAKLSGVSATYEDDARRLVAMFKGGRLNADSYNGAINELVNIQPGVKAAHDAQAKALADVAKANEEARKASAKYYDGLAKGLDALDSSNQKLRDQVEEIGLTTEALNTLRLARLDATIAQEEEIYTMASANEASVGELLIMRKRIDLLKEQRSLTATGQDKQAGVDSAKAAFEEWKKGWEATDKLGRDVFVTWATDGSNAAKKIGDTLKTALLSAIYEASLKPMVMQVYTSIMGTGGAAGAANLLGSAANGAGGLSGLLGQSSTLTGLATYGKMFGGALADGWGAAMAGNATSAISGGLSTAAGASGAAGAGVGIGQAIGAAAPYVLAAMAVAEVAKGLNGGSEYTTGTGISGKFSSSSFSGRNYQTWQNDGDKLFGMSVGHSSSGTNYSTMDGQLQQSLGLTYAAIVTQTAGFAKALGASTDAITGYSEDIKLALGSDAGANQKAIEDLFKGIGDRMAAAALPGLEVFSKYGETTGTTLARLGSSLGTVNSVLRLMRQRTLDLSLAGGDAASKLADLFGGLDNLSTASKTFYEIYYNEAERTADSQGRMTAALAELNLSLPDSKDAFIKLRDTLDLSTESGRKAYAILTLMGPEFATTSEAMARIAKEDADQIISKAKANTRLVAAMKIADTKVGDVSDSFFKMSGELSYINTILGDSTSAVIGFADGHYTLQTRMTDSQASTKTLTDQIDLLKEATGSAAINFDVLQTALSKVDTATFTNTIALVFQDLGERIKGTISSISSERIAVREAAIGIINPAQRPKNLIAADIASINTAAPAKTGMASAALALEQSMAAVAKYTAERSGIDAVLQRTTEQVAAVVAESEKMAALKAAQTTLSNTPSTLGRSVEDNIFWTKWETYANPAYAPAVAAVDTAKSGYDKAKKALDDAETARLKAVNAASTYESTLATMKTYRELNWAGGFGLFGGGGLTREVTAADPAAAKLYAEEKLKAAESAKDAASKAATAATLNYAKALQDFTLDASKSVTRLGRLREETVKYYESQKALADLMATSAAGIRGTITAYKYSQKTDEQKYQDLAGQFSAAYTASSSASGSALAGYGDKINGLINPLIDLLNSTGRGSLIDTYLSQAEQVAKYVDKGVLSLGDYQGDSLKLLGDIDKSLGELDLASQSVERTISEAIKAGTDKTLEGLRAVVAAISGASIPAFATGGYHTGGIRLVGENGPELEVTGPSQIFNASQTRSMLARGGNQGGSGGNADVVDELRSLRSEVVQLRAEARATAVNTGKASRIHDKWDRDGLPNPADTTVLTY